MPQWLPARRKSISAFGLFAPGLLAVLLTAISAQCRSGPIQAPVEPEFHWSAHWIGATPGAESASAADARMAIFRREFLLSGRVAKATLRISGLGQFEAHINGHNVTRAVMTPGWTNYRKRVLYDRYDVTAWLHPGANAIGVLLGNGMFHVVETKGRYTKFENSFGAPRLIAQLDVTFAQGGSVTIASDADWKTAPGPIVYSSTYGGEDYDARLETDGWDRAGLPDAGWRLATPVEGPGGALLLEDTPPVLAMATYRPVRVTYPQPGVAVYDLGRNFSGWPRIAVRGPRGAWVKLVCGELLDGRGRVTQRSANAFPGSQNEFNYTLRGRGVERWSPRFSYYGFRYVEARTTPRQPVRIVALEGQFLHDALRVDGRFRSSDGQLNRIHALIDAAMLSNAMSVLTDCPHREKLGWLEQTHLAGPSLMYNFHLAELYDKMAADMRDSQLPNGLVPSIAPEYPVFEGGFRDSPEWGAAIVLSPWTAYRFYGDRYGGLSTLRAQYGAMRSYMAYLHGRLQGGLLTYGLGDWYDIGPGEPGESKLTTKGVTATATYFEALTAMSRIASLLDRTEDARGFDEEADRVRAAFNARYFHPESGEYDRGSQTANAMPLALGLVPEGRRKAVLANLIRDIRAHGNHVTAGDIGFHYLIRALTDGGRSDVLYDMLSRTDKPSYGDQLAHGATTLTEAWDANPSSSQNHFMLGHAEEWFYRGLAGIDLDMSREAGEQIRIAPAVVGDLRWARASYLSPLGRIESRWSRSADALTIEVEIPAGTTATVMLPSSIAGSVRLDGRKAEATVTADDDRGYAVSEGKHRFKLRLAQGGSPHPFANDAKP